MAASQALRLLLVFYTAVASAAAPWCVVRSDADEQALQTALDYACGAGADCAPIQPSGLCYLPNTVQAHASYAFNSYFQRSRNAPGSCSFSGTAATATSDPSYGSCVYPSSPRNAGGSTAAAGGTTPTGTATPRTTPAMTEPPPPPGTTMPFYGGGGGGGGAGPVVPDSPISNASQIPFSCVLFLLVFSLVFWAV